MSDSREPHTLNNVSQIVDTLHSMEDDDREATGLTIDDAIYIIRRHTHDALTNPEAYVDVVSALSTLIVALDRGSPR